MDNIYSTAKFGEIGIFLSEKMGTNDVSKALILISELKDLIRQEERERAAKIIEEAPDKEEFGACNDGDAYAEIGFNEHARKVKKWKQEALKKLNETV